MEHINQLSERIATLVPEASTPVEGTEFNIRCFVDDIFKIIKNINETSINEADRAERLYKLSEQAGIYTINLI